MKNCFRNIQDHFCCVRKNLFGTAWYQISENRWSRIIPNLFLIVLTLLSCWVLAGRHGMFASNVDWISQHSVFPDYFRQQFYETGKLFSEFAANIGGGQNIYYFSYYGLYSPILLPAYFLPFVKMSDYLICVSILCLAASVMLLYGWLKTCGFPFEICLSCAVMHLLASPMIYQSYRQVMFVNYMPFLCIALIGIERYWNAGKIGIYTAGVFLMVMTSFYFSISGIFVLMIYGISRCRKVSWKHAFVRFLLPVISAVAASGFLLVPTACVLLSRSGNSSTHKVLELLIPDFSCVRFTCGGYGIGLTTWIFTILLTGIFYKDWKGRFLSAGCLAVIVIPFFSWMLNGGLYVRDKSLIPFLPLLCYLAALYLARQKHGKISFTVDLACYMLTVLWCCISFILKKQAISTQRYQFILFQSILMLVCFFSYWRCKRKRLMLLVLPSIVCLALFGIKLNESEGNPISKIHYEDVTDSSWESAISDITNKEKGLYRLEQGGSMDEKKDNINRIWNTRQWITSSYASVCQNSYQNFRGQIFQTEQPFRNQLMQPASDNPLFQKLMGVKYIIKRNQDIGSFEVDVQEHAAPVIYATDKLISQEQYEALPFPYNQTALMQYAVTLAGGSRTERVLSGQDTEKFREIRRTEFSISEKDGIQKLRDGYAVHSKENIQTCMNITSDTDINCKDRILFVQFKITNNLKNQDVVIDLEGTRNKLCAKNHIYYNGNTVFSYALLLPANNKKTAVLLGKGDYSVTDIQCFVSDASILEEDDLYQSHFLPDWEKTKGNCISGWIYVENTGYLVTSIPYDKGFSILEDGKSVPVQKVNTAFIGTAVSKGKHRIDIIYHTPGFKEGKVLSCIGLGLWVIICFRKNIGCK